MTEPHIYRSGPHHRIWELPDGTYREQRIEMTRQTIRLNAASSDAVKAAAEQTILDEVSSRAVSNTDEPIIQTEFDGWVEQELIGDDGFVFGWMLVGTATAYYWPSMNTEEAA